MKRKLSFILAAVLIAGTTTTGYAAGFADINNVPWEGAKAYITSVSDLKLMVGDKNSKGQLVFRPKDRVTYCETVQLAYSTLKTTGNLKSETGLVSKWTNTMKNSKIPTWAYDAVAYALEYNILSQTDVTIFMESATKSRNATREDVSVIFGKMLSSFNSVNVNASLTFGDKDKVAKTSVPYVDLLARLNILVGDDKGNFNPRNYINRSEMAVLTSKTYNSVKKSTPVTPPPVVTPPAPTATTISGSITAVDRMGNTNMISVYSNGKNVGFIGDSTTFSVAADGRTMFNFMDIDIGDVVTVTSTDGKASKIVVNIDAVSKDSVSDIAGTIDEITNSTIYIYTTTGKDARYDLASGCSITINGTDSSMRQLFDAVAEGTVRAELSANSSKYITNIKATTNESDAITGTIYELDSYEITVKKSSGSKTTYDLASGVTYRLDGSSSTKSEITKLMDKHDVYVSIYRNSKNEVSKIVASSDKIEADEKAGTMTYLSSSQVKLTISGGSSKTYTLGSSVAYKLDGSSSTFTKVSSALDRKDLKASIYLDSNGKVTRIEAKTSDSSTGKIEGTLTSLSSSTVKIKKSSSSSTTSYTLSNDVTYRLDGSSSSRSRISSAIENGDVTATITIDDYDEVTKIDAEAGSTEDMIKGTIKAMDSESIQVKNSAGKSKYYDYSTSETPKFYLDDDSSTKNSVIKAVDRAYDRDDDDLTVTVYLDSRGRAIKIKAYTEGGVSSSSSSSKVTGILKDITEDDIRIKEGSKTAVTYDFINSPTYRLDGYSSSAGGMLRAYEKAYDNDEEMSVTISLDSRDRVTKVEATTGGKITDTGRLMLVTDDHIKVDVDGGREKLWYVSDTAIIKLNGATISKRAMKNEFIDNKSSYDYDVELTVSSDSGVEEVIKMLVRKS